VTGNSPNWKKTPSLVAGLFLIVGSVIPLSDVYIPQQYPPKNAINLVQQMESEGILQQIEIDEDYLRDFINAPGARLLWGKGLYPRFYNISRGEPDQYSFLQTKPYPRFTLTIISQNGGQVILPMTKPPTDFPNGSQVYAIGCSNHQALNALALVLVKQDGLATLISRQPEVPWSCPVPEPVCDDNRNCN
jgi:hypothetical protein